MPATNKFSQTDGSVQSPATSAFAITPHATNELSYVTRAIYVGSAGSVVAKLADDASTVTFANVPAGAILPIRARLVHTDSTATSIVGLV